MRKWWIKHVVLPRFKKRLADGVVAVQWLNQQMIDTGMKRQQRRHLLREIDRNLDKMTWILDLLYTGRKGWK